MLYMCIFIINRYGTYYKSIMTYYKYCKYNELYINILK